MVSFSVFDDSQRNESKKIDQINLNKVAST